MLSGTYISDPRVIDVDNAVWRQKTAHVEYAKQVGGGHLKVISVYTGGFLDMAFNVCLPVDFPTCRLLIVDDP